MSEDLRKALGMGENEPPPWLINMQRYGPPPSYPSLKIPGLNAPIPEGTSYGYHPGGWGKPPVDEFGTRSRFSALTLSLTLTAALTRTLTPTLTRTLTRTLTPTLALTLTRTRPAAVR